MNGLRIRQSYPQFVVHRAHPRGSALAAGRGTLDFLRDRRLWFVCGLILLSRLTLLFFTHWLAGDDGPRYLQEAVNLRDFGVFSSSGGGAPVPSAHDLPLYPLLLSCLLAIVPAALAIKIAAGLNAVFFTAAAAGLYGLASLLSGRASVALIATAVFSLFPETLPYSLFYMPDSLFVAVFVWSIFLMVSFFETGRQSHFLVAFGLLALSVLIKPASLFFGVVFVAWSVLFWPRRDSVMRRVGWIACGLALELAVFTPWLLRNERDFGHPVLTTITGTNLFRENYRMMLEDTRPGQVDGLLAEQENGAQIRAGAAWANPIEQSDFLGAAAKREIKANWVSYLRTTLKRHPRLYMGTGALALLRLLGDNRDTPALEAWQSHPSFLGARAIPAGVLVLQLISWLVLGLAYAAAIAGAILLIRRRAWFPLAVAGLTLIYFAVLIGPVTYTRYRMPMAPFFAMLAAYGLLWAAEGFRTRTAALSPVASASA